MITTSSYWILHNLQPRAFNLKCFQIYKAWMILISVTTFWMQKIFMLEQIFLRLIRSFLSYIFNGLIKLPKVKSSSLLCHVWLKYHFLEIDFGTRNSLYFIWIKLSLMRGLVAWQKRLEETIISSINANFKI